MIEENKGLCVSPTDFRYSADGRAAGWKSCEGSCFDGYVDDAKERRRKSPKAQGPFYQEMT